LLLVCVLLPAVLARRAFPIQTDIDVEKLFQRTNANIDYDDTNYLVDEAGPYAVCENVEKSGQLTVLQKAEYKEKFGDNRVVGMIGTVRSSGLTRTPVKADINSIMAEWTRTDRFNTRNEYRDQINNANVFGCAVEPGCRHNYRRDRENREIHDTTTIVVCLFCRGRDGGRDGGREAVRDPRDPRDPRRGGF